MAPVVFFTDTNQTLNITLGTDMDQTLKCKYIIYPFTCIQRERKLIDTKHLVKQIEQFKLSIYMLAGR